MRRILRRTVWGCLVAGLLLSGAAAAGGGRARVAVFQLLPGGLELSEEKLAALSFLVGARLAEAARVDVLAWDEIHTYLRTQDQYMCFDRSCQLEVERALDPDYSLGVQIMPMGKSCHLAATLYRRGEAASLRSALVKGGCGEDALVAGLERLVDRIAAQGRLRPRGAQRVAAGGGKAARAPGEEAAPARPRFLLFGSMLYSPAPLMLYRDGGLEHAKSPDQYGPWVGAELRVGEYGSLGLQLAALFGTDRALFIPALRLGVVFELLERMEVFGRLLVGMAYFHDAAGAGADYLGFDLGLGGGARYMFLEHLGVQVELSGGSDTVWLVDSEGAGHPRDELSFLKLELAVGVVGAW